MSDQPEVTMDSLLAAMADAPDTHAIFDRDWLDGLGIDVETLAKDSGRLLKRGSQMKQVEEGLSVERRVYILEAQDQET